MGNQDALPDAILELVLSGLDSPLWLHRAALTCKRWRRIIADYAFHALHSKRSIIAGIYYNQRSFDRPRFEPSPSAVAHNFSLDFVPSGGEKIIWTIKDSRGSLLVLYREDCKSGSRDLIVCEPLTRRHEVIHPPKPPAFYWRTTAVLLDGGGDEGAGGGVIGMSSFRVLLCSAEYHRIRACMFTSSSSSWHETSINIPSKMCAIGSTAGRHYWHDGKKTAVALDQSTLKFTSFMLPNDEDRDRLIEKVALTTGRDGEARIIVDMSDNILKIFMRIKGGAGGEDAEEWALEKTIQISAAMLGLPHLWWCRLHWQQHEHAGIVAILVLDDGPVMRFGLDMETIEVERLPDYVSKGYPYEFPWPPPLRART